MSVMFRRRAALNILPGIKGANQGAKDDEPSLSTVKVPNGVVISWGFASGAATGAAINVVAKTAARAKYLTNILKMTDRGWFSERIGGRF
jgi:hypothetical protein